MSLQVLKDNILDFIPVLPDRYFPECGGINGHENLGLG